MEQQPSTGPRTQPAACPLQQQQQQPPPGADEGAAGEGADADPSRIWLPGVVHHVASFLGANERACTLRLVNKAAAAQFRGPQHTTVRLSLAVPHHAFVRHWGSPGAARSLTLSQRQQLPRLTARSGSIANLEVLLARDDLTSPLAWEVLVSAAGAGQLEVCRWLRQQGCSISTMALYAAVESGLTEVCEWLLADEECPYTLFCAEAMEKAAAGGNRAVCECLLASGYTVTWCAAPAAARGGHVGLMDWLLAQTPQMKDDGLLPSAAAGCDLLTLQRLHQNYLDTVGAELSEGTRYRAMGRAAGSPTADWRDKVEWLEWLEGWGQGGVPVEWVEDGWAARPCRKAARRPDGRERLEWLQRRGYTLSPMVAWTAAESGNVDVLGFVLGQGVQLDSAGAHRLACRVAAGGDLAVLKVLHAHSYGPYMDHTTVAEAAGSGHLAVVAWLVEMLGAAVALTVDVFAGAADSGSAELLAWLHERGCPWDASVMAAAAGAGSEEQLEWLAERGCSMGDDGGPYQRALLNADMAVLRCLHRLGCPWGQRGPMEAAVVEALAVSFGSFAFLRRRQLLLALAWLDEHGCAVSWASVECEAENWGESELLTLARQLGPARK